MAKRPTEEDLGIEITPEEQEILSRPAPEIEADVPHDDDGDEAPAQLAVPKPDAEPRAKDPVTGKFVAKPKDAAPGAEAAPANPAKPPPGFVDNRALQEERALRRQTEERLQVLLDTLQKREAREAKKDEPAPPAKPALDTDPLGFVGDVNDRLTRIENETKAQTEARQAEEREAAEFQQALNVAGPQFNEAKASNPAVEKTYNALLESIAREICFNNGIPANSAQMTPAQKDFVGKEMTKMERAHIRHAVASGQNVAEYMMNFAAVRGIQLQPQAADPAAAPAAAAQPAQKPIAERKAAQQRHMSIGDLPGSAAPASITAKDLAKMSPKEFAAFAKSLGDAGMDELFAKA
jgi:hypothetical protein